MDLKLPLAVVLSGVLGLLVTLVLGRTKYRTMALLPAWVAAVGVELGVIVGSIVAYGPRVWPSDVTYRIPHVAALASTSAVLLFVLKGKRQLAAWGATVAFAVLSAWLLLAPRAAQPESGGVLLIVVGALLVSASSASVRLGVRTHSRVGWGAAVLNAIVIAACCGLSGSVTVGLLGGMVTAALVGVVLAGVLVKPRIELAPPLLVASFVQFALLGLAFAYSEMRTEVLALCSALIVLFGALGAWKRADVARIVLVATLGGVAIWRATIVAESASPSGYGTPTPAASDGSGSGYDYDYGY